MHDADVEGMDKAIETSRLFMGPRCCKLDRLERYVCGTQYEGRPDFLEPEEDVPLRSRAPNIVYNAPQVAIGQHVDFALGEGRFPTISTGVSEDDSEIADVTGLTKDQSEKFDAWLTKFLDAVNFEAACDEGMAKGEGVGTAGAIVCARKGELGLEPIDPKWSEPTFEDDGRTVTKLVIQYPYVDVQKGVDGKQRATCLLYRREIDEKHDVTFLPCKAPEDGRQPTFTEGPGGRVAHGFSFCPVIWHKRRRGAQRCNELDGHALHTHETDELDALNFSLSQRFRAVILAGDPQIVETGVEKGEQVAPISDGRAVVLSDKRTGHSWMGMTTRPRLQRKKGAGSVWRYENKDAKVYMLIVPAEVIEGMSVQIRDLEEKIASCFGYTKLEIQGVRGAMSGKALGFLFARTTAHVDRERSDFWRGYMLPAISMLIRAAYELAKAKKTLFVPGIKKMLSMLARFDRPLEGGATVWRLPQLKPTWGDYFEPTAEDEKYTVDMTLAAFSGGVIPLQVAVEKVQPIFRFQNAAAIVDAVQKEADERAKKAIENAKALGTGSGDPKDKGNAPKGDGGKDGTSSGGNGSQKMSDVRG